MKKVKRILKNTLLVSPVVVGIALSGYGCSQFCSDAREQVEAQTSNREIVQKVLRTEEFERFEDDYRQALYNAYKSGAISAQEYDRKLAGARSEENVYAHREEYMEQEDQQTMNDNYNTITRTAESAGWAGAMVFGGGVLGTLAYGICYDQIKNNKREKSSGSIMSRDNYSRFFVYDGHEDEEISEME